MGALPIQRISSEEAGKILKKAYDAGITFYDTAHAYSDSEEKIGKALSDVRNHICIATKSMCNTTDTFWEELETSLRSLRTDYIDIYQFHNKEVCPRPDDGSGLYEAMLEAKKQGRIRFIGLTSHRVDIAREAAESGLYDTIQYPFCYLATEDEIELVHVCKEKNIGFIAMKALSGSLITNSAAAYAWQMQFDNSLPIWGIQKERELDEFLSYMKQPMSMNEELKAVIEKDRKELIGEFCRSCGYCMPCPKGIEIRTCARMIQLIRRAPSAGFLTEDAQKMMMKIEECINCGQCRSKCPYHLDTPTLLKKNLADYKNILAGKAEV